MKNDTIDKIKQKAYALSIIVYPIMLFIFLLDQILQVVEEQHKLFAIIAYLLEFYITP